MKPEDVRDRIDGALDGLVYDFAKQAIIDAIMAVWPNIEAQIRAKVADEIEAARAEADRRDLSPSMLEGFTDAARIARGETR